MVQNIRKFIAYLFIAIWAYFPSIIIAYLLYQVFWTLELGKDLIYTQVYTKEDTWLFILAALFLFYTVWHSSEIIGINKVKRLLKHRDQEELLPSIKTPVGKAYLYPSKKFFGHTSIILAYIVYSIIITSFIRVDGYTDPQDFKPSFVVCFLICFALQYSFFILIHKINKENEVNHPENKYIRFLYFVIIALAIFFYLHHLFVLKEPNVLRIPIIGILTVFLIQLVRKSFLIKFDAAKFKKNKFAARFLDFFSVQDKFASSFLIFNIISIAVLLIYILCVFDTNSAQTLGPLTFLLMAIGIMVGVINLIIVFSIKVGFNIYVFIFLFAIIFGQKENHNVNTIPLTENYKLDKIDLKEQVNSFLSQYNSKDTTIIPMFYVLANGGASRAGWWTAGILAQLVSTDHYKTNKNFYQHTFAISSASGGSVGVASFLYKHKVKSTRDTIYNSLYNVFSQDLLSPGLSYFLSFDLGRYLLPIAFSNKDRNIKLENAFDRAMEIDQDEFPIQALFTNEAYNYSPIFAFNVTRMQDGAPGVVSNMKYDKDRFNKRIDVLEIMPKDTTLTISSAAFLSARFPYISPAGRINAKDNTVQYFVDGGYFDNSGAGFIQELLGETIKLIKDSFPDYASRIKYHIVHIKNSAGGATKLEYTSPFKNDFLAPITTILGAYDMQTNTNDRRLKNYAKDKEIPYSEFILSDTHHFKYPMNWVLSDFVMHRMDSLIKRQTKDFISRYPY